jgi:hypothetical protein
MSNLNDTQGKADVLKVIHGRHLLIRRERFKKVAPWLVM